MRSLKDFGRILWDWFCTPFVIIHNFDYIQFFRNANVKLVMSVIFLFLPPAIFCGIWYLLEYEEVRPFTNVLVRASSLTFQNPEEMKMLETLTEAAYDFQKKQPESKVSFSEWQKINQKQDIQYIDFRAEVSKKFIEKLGVFSFLPYYRVCLINRNRFLDENETPITVDASGGALAIDQEGGYDFYALLGKEDCKNVVIETFKESTSTPTIGYGYRHSVALEEQKKAASGEPFKLDIATTSLMTSESKVSISLTGWVMLLAYFLFLFAWSFVFFQAIKIIRFFRESSSETKSE